MIIKVGKIIGKAKQVLDMWDELANFAHTDLLLKENPFQLDRLENQVNEDWWELRLWMRLN